MSSKSIEEIREAIRESGKHSAYRNLNVFQDILDHLSELAERVEKMEIPCICANKPAPSESPLPIHDVDGPPDELSREDYQRIEDTLIRRAKRLTPKSDPTPPHFEGYEWTGEFRLPMKGEWHYNLPKGSIHFGRAEKRDLFLAERDYQYTQCCIYRKLNPKPNPRQLDVDVAKALGHHVMFSDIPGPRWLVDDIVGQKMYNVPDYSHDLAAALGALEEYSNKVGIRFNLSFKADTWEVNYETPYGHSGTYREPKKLPVAICEVIVKHR